MKLFSIVLLLSIALNINLSFGRAQPATGESNDISKLFNNWIEGEQQIKESSQKQSKKYSFCKELENLLNSGVQFFGNLIEDMRKNITDMLGLSEDLGNSKIKLSTTSTTTTSSTVTTASTTLKPEISPTSKSSITTTTSTTLKPVG